MTGITATGEKKLMLFSGRAHPELTNEIAGCLGI
ncbi:MAG: ribose-phosphate diphosphokinase, partial [Candidatus Dormibacteraceae bacterium]